MADSLLDLPLEQLMNLSVTSVSKREQKLSDAAAAISVLSHDDLRRSGATTIMEALRLVPGVNVGSINASQWSISARGFNGLYANKLLVLVDGRAVYNPLFGGVFWDLQQTMLEDVNRVEVIRGPGATLWGANAVNGVINVVTKSAKETQGAMAYAGGGNIHQALGGGRFGGQIGEHTYYRVFGSYFANDDYPLANGQSAGDSWQGGSAGFRLDHYPEAGTQLTWQGDVTVSDLDDHASDGQNLNNLVRWSRELSDTSSFEIQAYYDRTHRNEVRRARLTTDTLDLEAQHQFALGEHHMVIWGGGYRFIANQLGQTTPLLRVVSPNPDLQLFSAFVQDEFRLVPDRLTLTAGVKMERNDFTGFEFQPSVRGVFKPTAKQTVWAAASRAVRTPSLVSGRDVFAVTVGAPFIGPGGTPYVPTLMSDATPAVEDLRAFELGYRMQPLPTLNLDLAGFYNEYRRLITFGPFGTFTPGVPVGTATLPFDNYNRGETYGGEASATWAATDQWRLTASYALLLAQIHGAGSTEAQSGERSAPRHQATLRSAYNITPELTLDTQVRYVDSIAGVPAYVTADVRLAYRITDRLDCSLVGQNLLEKRHLEQPAQFFATQAQVPRGFYAKLNYRF